MLHIVVHSIVFSCTYGVSSCLAFVDFDGVFVCFKGRIGHHGRTLVFPLPDKSNLYLHFENGPVLDRRVYFCNSVTVNIIEQSRVVA